ncbi:phospholipase D family protein [Chryseobacterium shandongense]|uniref:phospholipase D family protein n=1 Tax=Chryseobacterium shandongense TaxID=1493872 RepID=UPI000F4E84BE|nr:phospholipase D family protein [Chryseobacterium shandongense]
MLNPRNKKDRLNYGELLAAPEGFVLTKAVGTTYSLDLYALLAIPVAMFYAKSMEGDFQQNRYDVLDAIRQSKDKIDLFCQRGKICVTNKYNSLLAFMEDCVEEITPAIANASFHPKIWVLRFEKGKEQFFRLIILSRNLTFDRSWDVAYFTEGIPGGPNVESQKLSRYLAHFYKQTKRKEDTGFLKSLGNVSFQNADGFSDFMLYPILGIENAKSNFRNPLPEVVYEEMLIMSPFVDAKTLKRFRNSNEKLTLFSREEELDKLSEEDLENIDCYCMNSLIVNGEDYLDAEENIPVMQNLHAKLFIGKKNKTTDWYIGSANCTSPAYERNAEMLIKTSSKIPISEVKNMLTDDKYSIFIKYERTANDVAPDDQSLDRAVRELIFNLTKIVFNGTLNKREQGENYDLNIIADLTTIKDDRFVIKANVLHRNTESKEITKGIENSIDFENISISNISRYLGLTIYYESELIKSLLVKMDLTPPEEREDVIFNELINSKIKFFQYLQFILNPDQFSDGLNISQYSNADKTESELLQKILGSNNSIYESLMLAASRSPRKLKEIDGIINRLQKMNSEVVSDFLPIWEVFKEFAHA